MTQSPLRSKLRLERTDERSNVLAFHDLEVRHHEVEGQEPAMHGQFKPHVKQQCVQHLPPAPFFGRLELCDVELGHILRRETAVGAEAAVVVHGEDELDSISEGEDDAFEAESVADVLDTELWVLGEDHRADGFGQDALFRLLAALGAHRALPRDE